MARQVWKAVSDSRRAKTIVMTKKGSPLLLLADLICLIDLNHGWRSLGDQTCLTDYKTG